ncbi:MAG: phosphatidate cytidylyltransferase [Clostridia bacterium]|nr:phosphatidate cytidylyltransferase [Clostridia bacterium]
MNLLKRCISGAIMIVLAGGALWLGGWFLAAVAGVVSVLMMLDVSSALRAGGYPVSRPVLISAAALLFPAIWFFDLPGYLLVTGLALLAITLLTVLKKEPDFKGVLGGFFALIYPLFYAFMVLSLALADCKNGTVLGKEIILETVAIACVADAFAYLGGSLLGKRKFCPAISPKKTVAGFLAALIGGGVAGVLLSFWNFGALPHDMLLWAPVGVLCGAVGQLGDLLASMLKRHCGIKDYGQYIPGHGGMMDRMDSIGACLIVVVLCMHRFVQRVL